MLLQEKTTFEFSTDDARMAELIGLAQQIEDVKALSALAEWDQNTEMPEGAGEVRGNQMATIQGVLHEFRTNPRLGTLLDELETRIGQAEYTDADAGLLREMRRMYDQATRLPRTLVEELARVSAGSFEAWRRARERNDFASFAPWLKRMVALQREVADRFGYEETRYDALLDLYEPGMTVSKLDKLFEPVRAVSATLLRRIEASGHSVDDSCLQGDFDPDKQLELGRKILKGMGYDFSRGALAVSPHPFTTGLGSPFDVRVTVLPHRDLLQASIMAAIHEGGHALYEQGSAETLARTPIAGGASMGVHESQSRLWENAIGRSTAFWQGQFAAMRETFPRPYAEVDPAAFARALNKVQPSLIRIEADEVTYNLHIIVRYELEKAMVNGDVDIESLPRLWNAKYREYLGIEPQRDSEGVLQDIHWTSGFGYFPSYTLGNLYSAQIYATLRQVYPDFDERLSHGDTAFILNWLREHMYTAGATYLPDTLMKQVTGEAPTPAYFVRYLTGKFERIYGL
ncbi:MAG TPA: carboxypeptidase M32 [Ktedonobacteraceae bacterium]|nr:carboxypeptidase M32 [Ktedonobacteraceae bacterium]